LTLGRVMKSYDCSSYRRLIDIIAAGNPDDRSSGSVVALVRLWDGRVVRGSYYEGSKKADVETPEAIFIDSTPLHSFIEALLQSGTSFVVMMGSSDDTCCLEWTISGS
ncbi:MAG: hypothetical protein NTV81_02255, partial [Candidatus Komeilibacteria bacterium]|nr:hypothetical protein [Candidatus Komeilibacteria bacterium]